ncbi:MAG: hypothetical protein HYS80_00210 [Candidatus Aenigmarchaeota archaeon]|nr:hypothetical protein [Candidatus Aenigmarchaeota archaeon]
MQAIVMALVRILLLVAVQNGVVHLHKRVRLTNVFLALQDIIVILMQLVHIAQPIQTVLQMHSAQAYRHADGIRIKIPVPVEIVFPIQVLTLLIIVANLYVQVVRIV